MEQGVNDQPSRASDFGGDLYGPESPRTDRSLAAEGRRRISFARALRASSADSVAGFAVMTRGLNEPSAANYESLAARQNSHHLAWSPART